MIRIPIRLALACTMLTLPLLASAAPAPPTLKEGVLMIAIEGTYPPFTYKDEQGKLTGFDVEVAQALAQRLKLKPEFVLTAWDGILAGLQADKYDVIINQVGITAERQKSVAFSEPYVYSRAQIAVQAQRGTNFKSLSELKGKRVGVGLGTTFEKDLKAVGGIDIVTYGSAPESLADLVAGRLDAIFNDRLVFGYLAKSKNLPVKGTEAVGQLDSMGIAMKRDKRALQVAVNQALKQLRQDGTLSKLGQRWFGMDVSRP